MKEVHVVGAVIVNSAREVLCARRSAAMSLPGVWEFPGGKVEPGEDPRDCLKREIREELACDVAVGEEVAVAAHLYPHIRVRLTTYMARILSGTPSPAEHDALEWRSLDTLRDLEWAPADLPTLERLLAEPELLAWASASRDAL